MGIRATEHRDDTAAAMHRDVTAAERRRLANLSARRVEAFLDAGSGKCYLARRSIGRMVQQALLEFAGSRYRIFAWCVMPNHVHVVFQPLGEYSLAEIVHSWKSYSAKRANAILNRRGQFWQREYYDRLIRDSAELHRAVQYVVDNPARANLKNWPWVGGWRDRRAKRAGGTPALRQTAACCRPFAAPSRPA